jgi:hypothetical protein
MPTKLSSVQTENKSEHGNPKIQPFYQKKKKKNNEILL